MKIRALFKSAFLRICHRKGSNYEKNKNNLHNGPFYGE